MKWKRVWSLGAEGREKTLNFITMAPLAQEYSVWDRGRVRLRCGLLDLVARAKTRLVSIDA